MSIELKGESPLERSAEEEEKVKVASFVEILSNADRWDCILMLVGTAGGIITGAIIPTMNVLFGKIMDDLNGDSSDIRKKIASLCVTLVVVAAVNFFSAMAQVLCWTLAGERQTQRYRERYVRAILSQEVGWFDQCGAHELSTKVANLTGKAQDGMTRKVGDFIQYAAQILSCVIVAFYYNWKITLVLLATVPFMGFAGNYMISAITEAQSKTLTEYAGAGGIVSESLTSIRTVQALNAQPFFITRYREKILEAFKVGMKKSFRVGLGNGMMFGVYLLIYALGFWFGGELLAQDKNSCHHNCLTGGKVMTVFLCVTIGAEALGQITPPLTAMSEARTAIAQLLEVINRVPIIQNAFGDDQGVLLDGKAKGEVVFNDVEFAYPSRPNLPIYKNFNLAIQPGETVALVGRSGCGKSTVINLLLRFYDPTRGVVTLDGIDLKTIQVQSLRSVIGYVGQEPVLFAGSIAENIAYGLGRHHGLSPESLREAVVRAAKSSNAHDFIMTFPEGYDTVINHGNSSNSMLSGGQKQRIAIARALIKSPALLLLDEATSALDAASERVVQESIDALSASGAQTTIIVAHRLSTIRGADKICVIDGGRIVEMGKHEELLALRGFYSDLVKFQVDGLEEGTDVSLKDKGEVQSIAALSDVKVDEESGLVLANDPANEADDEEIDSIEQKEDNLSVSQRVRSIILRSPILLLVALVGSLLFGGTFPAWGYLLAKAQNSYYAETAHDIRTESSFYACLFILVAGVSFFSAIAQYYGILTIGERLTFQLRSEMFEALMRQPMAFFDNPHHSVGALSSELAEAPRLVHRAFGESLAKQLMALSSAIVGIILAFISSWRMALVVLATFPLMIGASAVQMQAFQGQQHEEIEEKKPEHVEDVKPPPLLDSAKEGEEKKERESARQIEAPTSGLFASSPATLLAMAFTQIRTISAFSFQAAISEQYALLTSLRSLKRQRRAVVASMAFGSSNSIMLLSFSLMFWFGSEEILAGRLDFDELLVAVLGLMFASMGLGQAMNELGDQKAAVRATRRIFYRIDQGRDSPIDGLKPLAVNSVSPIKDKLRGRIELKNVRFAYPSRPDTNVCRDYNLTIEPGQTVALVGPSGSGKSTIIQLLLRFYDPLEGEVLLDGVDIRNINVRWLRSQIGYVGQEPALFEGSVEENIRQGRATNASMELPSLEDIIQTHGNPTLMSALCGDENSSTGAVATQGYHGVGAAAEGAGDEEGVRYREVAEDVAEACKKANAHDFIMTFPQSYQTDVGASSVMVSGGQKQRIAIARALIKSPALLLLDEATSALDAASERVVQESIDALSASGAQTTIIVAHRLSTIRGADKICVIDGGRIVEMGKHEELLAKTDSLYSQLWQKQGGQVSLS